MHGHSATFADLAGKSVFITGGGSGIGADLTRGFLEQGAKVAFIGRSDYGAFVEEMGRLTGHEPLFCQGDVTDTEQLRSAIDAAEEAHGPLDVLVNNAAHDMRYDPMEVTPADWDAMHAVNLRHLFFAAQRAARSMRARGHGAIVNISSIAYVLGMGDLTVYTAAKAGIVGLTRSLADAWGRDGLRVNAILPGMVVTERQMELWLDDESIAGMIERQDLKQAMTGRDMVGPVLFLASDASRMMSGQAVIVDGGVARGP